MPNCYSCGKVLTEDEIGLHKKLVNRGAESFLCLSCLAEKFECPQQRLLEKIEEFRGMGCTLFSQKHEKRQ